MKEFLLILYLAGPHEGGLSMQRVDSNEECIRIASHISLMIKDRNFVEIKMKCIPVKPLGKKD